MLDKGGELNGEDLTKFYGSYLPTTANVIKLLDCVVITKEEKKIFGFLKKFIRGLSQNDLHKLLAFLTGSDLILPQIEKIKVMFTEHQPCGGNLDRKPVTHYGDSSRAGREWHDGQPEKYKQTYFKGQPRLMFETLRPINNGESN